MRSSILLSETVDPRPVFLDGHDGTLPIDKELDLVLRVGRGPMAKRNVFRGQRARDEILVQAALHRPAEIAISYHVRLTQIVASKWVTHPRLIECIVWTVSVADWLYRAVVARYLRTPNCLSSGSKYVRLQPSKPLRMPSREICSRLLPRLISPSSILK